MADMLSFRPLTEVEERVNLLVTEIHIQYCLKLLYQKYTNQTNVVLVGFACTRTINTIHSFN